MTLKELNLPLNEMTVINTGFKSYITDSEIWVKGIYNGLKTEFYVSSLGRVYNKNHDKFELLHENDSGYLYCMSYYKGKRTSILINRLVLESFNGVSESIKNAEADHINGDIKDNSIGNLQWLSRIDNLAKRTLANQEGINNSASKYTEGFILSIADELAKRNHSVVDIAKIFNVPVTTVYDIKYKHRWSNLLKDYDFSDIPQHVKTVMRYSDNDILSVAKLLLENSMTLKEISDMTGVSYDTVTNVYHKRCYTDLLQSYDFSNYKMSKSVFNNDELNKIDPLIIKGYSPLQICNELHMEYTKKRRNAIYDRKRHFKKG